MQDIEKLKKVIQEANPEIMKSVLGCETTPIEPDLYKWVDETTKFWIVSHHNYPLNKEGGDTRFLLDDGRSCIEKLEEFTILGRPIIWDDVAIAIGKKVRAAVMIRLNCKGAIEDIRSGNPVVLDWKLGKTLDDQSEKTINWLVGLLVEPEKRYCIHKDNDITSDECEEFKNLTNISCPKCIERNWNP